MNAEHKKIIAREGLIATGIISLLAWLYILMAWFDFTQEFPRVLRYFLLVCVFGFAVRFFFWALKVLRKEFVWLARLFFWFFASCITVFVLIYIFIWKQGLITIPSGEQRGFISPLFYILILAGLLGYSILLLNHKKE